MADKKFVAPDGIQIGAFTVDPATGDLTTTGNITIIGGGSFVGAGSGGGAPTPAPTPTPSPAPTPTPGYSTALLLPMDSANTVGGTTTTPDDSTDARTVTLNGAAAVSTAQSVVGSSSMYFDGSSYLTVDSNSDFAFGTGDFTIELWAYITGQQPTAYSFPVSPFAFHGESWTYGSSQSWAFWLTSTHIAFNGNQTPSESDSSKIYVPHNISQLAAWHHYAVSRQSGVVRLFVDGVQVASESPNWDISIIDAGPLKIGNMCGGATPCDANWKFEGYIDDLRIVNGAAVYTGNFTPPAAALTADSNTVLLCHFDSSSTTGGTTTTPDYSGAAHTATLEGNASLSTAVSVFGGGSMSFNGNGDTLTTLASSDFAFGTGDFTIEGWFYSLDSGASQRCLFDNRSLQHSGFGSTAGICIRENGNGFLVFNSAAGGYFGVLTLFFDTSTGRVANAWQHIALVRSSNTLTLYVDGVSAGSVTDSTNYIDTNCRISGFIDNQASPYGYYGYIDDVRIVKGYAVYTSNFTPPAAPLTAISG